MKAREPADHQRRLPDRVGEGQQGEQHRMVGR
jgi:hypothetical protein